MSAIRSPRPPIRPLSVGVAVGIPLALAAGVLVAGPARADVVGSVTYDSPGTYTWTVPAGTTSAVFDVFGAAGGGSIFLGTPGPQGGHVRAGLAVTAGDTFVLVVGGRGGGSSGPGPGLGGFNGGADSGLLITRAGIIFGAG